MDIHAEDDLTQKEVKKVWKDSFSDSDDFVDFYFKHRYNDDVNMVRRDDTGRLLSSMQLIPYLMTYCNSEVRSAYVSGACTAADCRNRCEMRKLLQEAHRRLYTEGVDIISLIPADDWLHTYYAGSGYADCFPVCEQHLRIDLENQPLGYTTYTFSTLALTSEEEINEVYAYFDRKMRERSCYLQHSLIDFKIIAEDLMRFSGGSIWVMRLRGTIVGVLLGYLKDGELLYVNEVLADDKRTEQALLFHVCKQVGSGRVWLLSPYTYDYQLGILECEEITMLGMARLINPMSLLTLYAAKYPREELFIQLKGDDAVAENNGYYTVQYGTCTRVRVAGKSYGLLTVSELTSMLLAREHPYMSLMLN